MNCPVCSAKLNAAVCPVCGYDASADAEARPTLTRINGAASRAARRAAWEKAYPPEADSSYAIKHPPSGREPITPQAKPPEPGAPETVYAWKPENGQRKVERVKTSGEAQSRDRAATDRRQEKEFVHPRKQPSADARPEFLLLHPKALRILRLHPRFSRSPRKAPQEHVAGQAESLALLRDGRRRNLISCVVSAAIFAICYGIYKATGDFLSLGYFGGAATILGLGVSPIVLIVNLVCAAAKCRKIRKARRQI